MNERTAPTAKVKEEIADNNEKTLTVGSLFSGIGGLELGLERAGMKVIWQVEIDDFCRKILERHWPEVRRYGDVHTVKGEELEKVDIICGGFPCQPVSVAGQRKGKSDERWLWPEFLRIIREVKPRWVVVENVPGLRSINSGQLFGEVLRDLAEAGYDAEWDSICASDLGARHRRERVFILAWQRRSGGVVADAENLNGSRPFMARNTGQQPEKEIGNSSASESTERCAILEALRSRNIGKGGIWNYDPADLCGSAEPRLGRMADGFSSRLDYTPRTTSERRYRTERLKCLGNAVVPQVAEYIGLLIRMIEKDSEDDGLKCFNHRGIAAPIDSPERRRSTRAELPLKEERIPTKRNNGMDNRM